MIKTEIIFSKFSNELVKNLTEDMLRTFGYEVKSNMGFSSFYAECIKQYTVNFCERDTNSRKIINNYEVQFASNYGWYITIFKNGMPQDQHSMFGEEYNIKKFIEEYKYVWIRYKTI